MIVLIALGVASRGGVARADVTPEEVQQFSAQDREMGRLYREFRAFRESPLFRRLGFARVSPYHGWLDAVDAFRDDTAYVSHLIARCDVSPSDLRPLALDHMSGKLTPHVRELTADWDACFP